MRVALVDDSALFRDGLAALLRLAGTDVAFEARSGEELLARLRSGPVPDVVVIDVRMPPTFTDEGLAAAVEVRERFPQVGVLVLSTYAETAYAARLLDASASGVGYLLKDRVDDVAALVDALERVRRGGTVVDPTIVRRLLERQARRSVLEQLTQRERDVLEQMAQGRSNAGIARHLHLSVKTVEGHIASVLPRLGVHGGGDDNRRVLAVLGWLRALDDGGHGDPGGPGA